MTCASCGATTRSGASWCGQCFAPVTAAPPAASAPAGRFVPPAAAPRADPVTSRWRKTDTTFGPVGRVAWTLAMVGVLVVFVFSGNPFAIGPWLLLAMPLVLRSVWAEGRVT